jgi:hypothetical protein
VRIEKVEETTSKKSQPMLVVELAIAQASITFRHYIVENEYFDGNMTKFFDCFSIPRGNFEFQRWIHRTGKAHIAKGQPRAGGKSFWEVAYLIVEKPGQSAPRANPAPPPKAQAFGAVQGTPPKGTFVEQPSPDGFTDDIPF